MKTEYQILWIDDEPRHIRGDIRNITSFLDDYGIELKVEMIEVTDDNCPTKQESFSKTIDNIDLDMVFVDFRMPEQGDVIIKHIRKTLHHFHLPILFYTGENSPEKILTEHMINANKDASGFLDIADGIYFCDRDHITEKAKLILTSLLKKENKAQHGRGLLMDRVSEIDSKLIVLLKQLWNDVPSERRACVLKTLTDRVDSGKKRATQVAQDIAGKSYDDSLAYLLEDARRWDTFTRANVLREVLRYIEGKSDHGKVLSGFYNSGQSNSNANLISMRNDYAHKASSEILADHNDEKCKFIRTETRKHLSNLKSLLGES